MSFVNRTPDLTLDFSDARASSGSLPTANTNQAAPDETMQVNALNSGGGCVGSFSLNDSDQVFEISYNHPFGISDTIIAHRAPQGYLVLMDALNYSGHDVAASGSVYQGVQSNTQNGVVAPLLLTADPSINNCQDFANSMFGPNVRGRDIVQSAFENPVSKGYVAPADFTGSQMAILIDVWMRQWLEAGNAAPSSDVALLAFLSAYIVQASPAGALSMWIPQIAYEANSGNPPVFSLSEYLQVSFLNPEGDWNEAAVSTFLTLLAGGAHFVAINAASDLPDNVSVQSLDTSFASSDLPQKTDIGNSHYANVLNVTGKYYLSIEQDYAPADCGAILSFLVGRTVNSLSAANGTYNTFFQLEGWQSSLTSARHNADYETFKQTLWNISTYGACAYSEKRGTTIFLAPPGWTPMVYQITRMMPYVGAYATSSGAPQGWLNTAVVSIPKDSPPLPQRYWE